MMGSGKEIVLVDEDGVEHHFLLYQIVELDEASYALLHAPEDEGELIVLRIEGSVQDGNLVTLDDDEWERVAEAIDGLGLLDGDVDGDEDDSSDGASH